MLAVTRSRTKPVKRDTRVQAPTETIFFNKAAFRPDIAALIHGPGAGKKEIFGAPQGAGLEKKEAAAMLRPKSREETPKEGYQTGNQIRAV
jgi:hypothetical protein